MSTDRPEPSSPDATTLPPSVRDRLNGELDGRTIVAWAEFDLDSSNQYCRQYVVLTDEALIVIGDGIERKIIPLTQIEEAKISEGLGVDRLRVVSAGKLAVELHYSRRQRRDMTRLHRKLGRRIPSKDGKPADATPEWLETVERATEQKEHCPKCGELIPSWAEGVCPRCLQKRKILWRLLDVAGPYRGRITLALGATLALAAMIAIPPYINRHLIDEGILKGNIRSLLIWSALLAGSIVLMELLGGLRLYALATVGTNVARDLRHKVYAHMHDLSLRYFAKRRTGSLITRVTNDTDRLWDFIVFGSVDLLRNVLMIIFIACFMVAINWRLALVALLPMPILGIVTYVRAMTMQRLFGRLWTYWSRMGAVVGDAIPGVRVVKAFANEQREIHRFDRRSDEYTVKEQEIHKIWTQLQPFVSGTMRLGGALVWFIGGYMVIKNPGNPRYTLGTLIMFTQ
ncbi:MAG TPA: ABC transporter transmembrane domain-containing protein, partial [Tepidisphaeraceae bacterium]